MRVTKRPWFGPKRHLGWGWSVSSWQGGLTAAVFIGLIVAAGAAFGGPTRIASVVLLLLLLGLVVLLTGDPPGRPGSRSRDR